MTELAQPHHIPVLPDDVLRLLDPQPGQTIVDATVGVGGHSRLIAPRLGREGFLIGLDQDESMLRLAQPRIEGCRVELKQVNFEHLPEILAEIGIERVDAVLADLGICSDQLDQAERGFSFQQNGPLDMRLDPSTGQPASALIQRGSERELADIFYGYGEERFSRRIARRIVENREKTPFETTEQLADLVRRCVPRGKSRHAIDPATRVFQALRIAVNDELGALERLLEVLPRCLKPGGRAVLISFHSLEDRRVKQEFRRNAVWQELTRKPVQAGEEETAANPRARSEKLRAAVLISASGGC